MQHYVDKNAVCPFYTKQEGLRVYCEGFCRDNSLNVVFRRNIDMDEHKTHFCCNINGYRKCPLYPVIEKQYEDNQ